MDVGDGKWKQVLGVFKTWKLKLNGNMIILFNLWDPQLCLVMPYQCTQRLSLSQTLSSFFLVFFLSILLIFILHFFFYTESPLITQFLLALHRTSTAPPQTTNCRYHKPPPQISWFKLNQGSKILKSSFAINWTSGSLI